MKNKLKKLLTLIRKNEKILKQASKQASKQTIVLFWKKKGGMLTLSTLPFVYLLKRGGIVRGDLIE